MNTTPATAHSTALRGIRGTLICAAALLCATAATAQIQAGGSAPEAIQPAPAANLQAADNRAPIASSAQAPGSNGLRIAPGSNAQPLPPAGSAQNAPATPDAEAIVRALTGAEPLQPARGIARTSYWQANGYWLVPLLAVIALATAAVGVALYRRSRKPVVVSPQVTALMAISNAEAHAEDKLFAIAVSDAVRRYIEARFHLRATEQTTEEFLQAAPHSGQLPPPALDALARLLQLCDLAKFARQGLSPSQRNELSQIAQELIGSLEQPQASGEQLQTNGEKRQADSAQQQATESPR